MLHLEDVMLSEISPTQKKRYFKNSVVLGSWSSQKKENRVVVARIYGKGILETYCLVITEFQFRKMKKFWTWVVVMVAEQYKCI